MTQNELPLVLLGIAKTFAFPLTAVLITAVAYGVAAVAPKLLDRWTRRVWNLR